ncbi:hypothetical protein [Streptomyces acidiscabies]|uniref:SCP2 domain-containing protein n=1 Tax=Streptomyces acidiscabies TaxID=42234 RepID=A0AAP6ELF7_9ACTN|nr:hypothetical protein [Streptomyces acidiscabies]MBP5935739.1 hypothetical protein [Streptomyces sp. LBUM 1476]MBZ3916366.1 hypothetical protein [Streptomyces acidiscabies]MDX2967054.1 hypothetical protein [Streptomyces acidiscabies]MDX3022785.1 hypothetical protein [Streptomyces acidiscabies]MDX3796917.1 hypothetical protein [Streptomyces acidiscabies]
MVTTSGTASFPDESWIGRWIEHVWKDPELCHTGRFSNFLIELVVSDGREIKLTYRAGTLALGDSEESDGETLTLCADLHTWTELFHGPPQPLRHDLLALLKHSQGIELRKGRLTLIRNLRVITRLVELGKNVEIH